MSHPNTSAPSLVVIFRRTLLLTITIIGLIGLNSQAAESLKPEEVHQKLQAGALLVDVRTPEEFKSKSLPGAVNIPVSSIKTGITNLVTDKSRAILLHCASGVRSARAEKELRSIGYSNVFNLGSYEQAKTSVGSTSR